MRLLVVVAEEVMGAGSETSTRVLVAFGVLVLPSDSAPFEDSGVFVSPGNLLDIDVVGSN